MDVSLCQMEGDIGNGWAHKDYLGTTYGLNLALNLLLNTNKLFCIYAY